MFVNPAEDDYRLQPDSPAIGTGRYGDDRGALPYSPTGIEDEPVEIPVDYATVTSYPNPFNARTTIKYSIPDNGEVKLEIFNIIGQLEVTLADRYQAAGGYSVPWVAAEKHSGIYFARLSYNGNKVMHKLVLIK